MSLAFAATVVGDAVEVRHFRARAAGGELAGTASYRGSERQPFAVQASATRLDPSRFGAFPSASLDGSITVGGTLAAAWAANVAVTLAPTARLLGKSLSGSARAAVDARSIRDASVDVTLATARPTAHGSFGGVGDRLDFTLDAPALGDLAPLAGARAPSRLAGRLRATGHVDGTLAAPGFGVEAHGEALQIGSLALDRFDVRGALEAGTAAARDRSISADATASHLTTPAGAYATAAVRVDGTFARHTATLKLAGQGLDAEAKLDGGATSDAAGSVWSGTLVALENRGAYPLTLSAPARVQFAVGRARLDDARIAIADGSFRIDTLDWNDGQLTTRGGFGGVPLAALARLSGTTLPLRSTLVLGGAWNVAATPRLNGTIDVHRERGDLYAAPRARWRPARSRSASRRRTSPRHSSMTPSTPGLPSTRPGLAARARRSRWGVTRAPSPDASPPPHRSRRR